MARTYSLSTLTSLSENYPDVWEAVPGELDTYWAFLNTVACIGVVSVCEPRDLDKQEREALFSRIEADLEAWSPVALKTLENFFDHHAKFTKRGLTPSDAVGHWVWINLAQHPKATTETRRAVESLRLVRPTGALIYGTFSEWWSEE